MTPAPVEEDLWRQFHRTVNMSATELEAWHQREQADRAADLPGRQVLAVLRKRRAELTAEDAEVMRTVVQVVLRHAEAPTAEPGGQEAGPPGAADRLRSIGHDPLLIDRRTEQGRRPRPAGTA